MRTNDSASPPAKRFVALGPASLTISALLAGAGGYLDAFTYVGHGHVFANAMTGNVVLLGVNLFNGSTSAALKHLPPIAAFMFGIATALAIQHVAQVHRRRTHYRAVLALELVVFLALSFLPPHFNDSLITVVVAYTASVQVQTFREVNGRSYNSTFTTGNLRTLSEAIFIWLFQGRSTQSLSAIKDFGSICTSFLLGAILGSWTTVSFGNRALLFEVATLACVAVLLATEKDGDMIVHQER